MSEADTRQQADTVRHVRGRLSGAGLTQALVAAYVLGALLLVPYAAVPGPAVPGLSAFFAAGVFVTELATAFLLFVRFRESQSASVLVLGCACLYSALMAIPYLLTFPDAVLRNGSVLGDFRSTALIFTTWIFGFAYLTLAAVVLEARFGKLETPRSESTLWLAIALVVAAVAVGALFAIVRPEWLPVLVGPQGWTATDDAIVYIALAGMLASILIVLLVIRDRSELFLWLALAMTAVLCGNLLSQLGAGRFTVGWSVSRLSWVFSGAILFLYFMAQFVRQQRLLGRSRDALERAVSARTADLIDMIGQRDLLLREVHHRVKNNFQVINSLISYQTSHSEKDETREALQSLHSRVYALGLVHQRLMQSDNLSTFDIRAFLSDLCVNVAALAAADARGITINVEADPLQTDLDFAGPLGLLVTELVSAAFAHFAQDQHGSVRVALHRLRDSNLVLEVADDAPSEPDLIDVAPVPQTRIVKALVAQLSGALNHELAKGTNGTIVRVTMPFAQHHIRSSGTAKFS